MKKGLVLSEIEGFTLIELIVVIGIMAILTSIGLAYFNNFNEEKKINSEISRFVDVLHLARSKSMTNDLTPMPACPDFSGYQIEIVQASPVISKLNFCCGDCLGANKTLLQSHNLYSTVSADNSYTILFAPHTGATLAKTVRFTNATIGKFATVTIQSSGLISNTDLSAL